MHNCCFSVAFYNLSDYSLFESFTYLKFLKLVQSSRQVQKPSVALVTKHLPIPALESKNNAVTKNNTNIRSHSLEILKTCSNSLACDGNGFINSEGSYKCYF